MNAKMTTDVLRVNAAGLEMSRSTSPPITPSATFVHGPASPIRT